MRMVLIGPPGAGKGTVSKFIVENLNIPYLSTGAILRDEITKGTELGKVAKAISGTGKLVPDDLVVEMVANKLKELPNGYLLDGFPRNLEQGRIFDRMLEVSGSKLDLVLHLEVDDEVVTKRLTERLECPLCRATYHKTNIPPKNEEGYCDICFENGDKVTLEQRYDDSSDSVEKRLITYHKETEPLVDFFKKKGILKTIDANCSTETMFNRVKNIIEWNKVK